MPNLLKALSVLLIYPGPELQQATGAISEALDHEPAIPARVRSRLHDLIEEIATGDLYELQERYVHLFDRTRSLSLHLFEHVHGESRDRGQAMIDLKTVYEDHGLIVAASELPDFLPLFLEFTSTLPPDKARDMLAQPVHVFTALEQRLAKRGSAYEAVFAALIALAAAKPDTETVRVLLDEPDPEADDLEALDIAWQDEPVTFGPGSASSCKDGLIARLRAARRPASRIH